MRQGTKGGHFGQKSTGVRDHWQAKGSHAKAKNWGHPIWQAACTKGITWKISWRKLWLARSGTGQKHNLQLVWQDIKSWRFAWENNGSIQIFPQFAWQGDPLWAWRGRFPGRNDGIHQVSDKRTHSCICTLADYNPVCISWHTEGKRIRIWPTREGKLQNRSRRSKLCWWANWNCNRVHKRRRQDGKVQQKRTTGPCRKNTRPVWRVPRI